MSLDDERRGWLVRSTTPPGFNREAWAEVYVKCTFKGDAWGARLAKSMLEIIDKREKRDAADVGT